jgi:hypothetical protein
MSLPSVPDSAAALPGKTGGGATDIHRLSTVILTKVRIQGARCKSRQEGIYPVP